MKTKLIVFALLASFLCTFSGCYVSRTRRAGRGDYYRRDHRQSRHHGYQRGYYGY